jgi:hypothetical protein
MPGQVQVRGGGGGGSIESTHSQPSARRTEVVSTTLRPLYFRERPDTQRTGGWLDLVSCLKDANKTMVGYIYIYTHFKATDETT